MRRVRPYIKAVFGLLALWLALGGASPGTAAAGWTFGPEYLARRETYEAGNHWYEREVYWRPAYLDGVYQFAEHARNIDYRRGPIITYGAAEVASRSLEYISPPHVHRVTRYRRPIYRRGKLAGYEPLPALTRREDACKVIVGEAVAQSATRVKSGGGDALRVVYRLPIYHSNSRHGRFLVGHRERVEIKPLAASPARPRPERSPAAGRDTPADDLPLDVALRRLDSVEDFRDYAAVAANRYARDIGEAFELGLVVGKYDARGRYYDPDTAITVTEMVNILARNYGADRMTQGAAAAAHLEQMGVALSSDLDAPMTVSALESMARQLAAVDDRPRADLLVIRDVLAGGIDTDGVITRAQAVAMYRPPAHSPTAQPGTGSPPAAGPAPPRRGDRGPSRPRDPGTRPAAGDYQRSPPAIRFVLVD